MTQQYTIQYLVDKLQIEISGKERISKISLLGVWLILLSIIPGWMIYYIISDLWSDIFTPHPMRIFAILLIVLAVILLTNWYLRVAIGLYLFLWHITGREILEFRTESIKVRKRILGIPFAKEYQVNEISNLQATDPVALTFAFTKIRGTYFDIAAQGPIAFKYKNSTVHLGLGLSVEEANDIISQTRKRFPHYNYASKREKLAPSTLLKFWKFMYRYQTSR